MSGGGPASCGARAGRTRSPKCAGGRVAGAFHAGVTLGRGLPSIPSIGWGEGRAETWPTLHDGRSAMFCVGDAVGGCRKACRRGARLRHEPAGRRSGGRTCWASTGGRTDCHVLARVVMRRACALIGGRRGGCGRVAGSAPGEAPGSGFTGSIRRNVECGFAPGGAVVSGFMGSIRRMSKTAFGPGAVAGPRCKELSRGDAEAAPGPGFASGSGFMGSIRRMSKTAFGPGAVAGSRCEELSRGDAEAASGPGFASGSRFMGSIRGNSKTAFGRGAVA